MKPIDLYKVTPEEETLELWGLEEHLDGEGIDLSLAALDKNKRVKQKIIKDLYIDGSRSWKLTTVWLDDQPVMITRIAGRSYRDFGDRFVTNEKLYREMIDYLKSLMEPELTALPDLVDENEDIPDLTYFYGHGLFPEDENPPTNQGFAWIFDLPKATDRFGNAYQWMQKQRSNANKDIIVQIKIYGGGYGSAVDIKLLENFLKNLPAKVRGTNLKQKKELLELVKECQIFNYKLIGI